MTADLAQPDVNRSVTASVREAAASVASKVLLTLGGTLGLIWLATDKQWLPLPIGGVAMVIVALALTLHHVRIERDEARKALADALVAVRDEHADWWRAQGARFGALSGEVYTGWMVAAEEGTVEWSLHTLDPVVDARIVDKFRSEATSAGTRLMQMPDPPRRFQVEATDPEDMWLNAVLELVKPGDPPNGSGSEFGKVTQVYGMLNNVVDASKVACAALAARRPPDARLRAARLSLYVGRLADRLDTELNQAVESKFSPEAQDRLDYTRSHIAGELTAMVGPTERRLFLTAPPHAQLFSAVPSTHGADWQKVAGQIFYLRELATRLAEPQRQ